jgi:tetratricopeptide (TPR) repeat protein
VAPEKAVYSLLTAPAVATDLPLKVATFNLKGKAAATVRVIIATEIGKSATAPENTAIGFSILAADGKVVSQGFRQSTVAPLGMATPGPLQTATVAEIPAGSYKLKLAVIDAAGHKGSVEHAFTAALGAIGGIEVTDLVLTPGATSNAAGVQLLVDPAIGPDPFNGYLELYGPAEPGPAPQITMEIAASETGPSLSSAVVQVATTSTPQRLVLDAPLPLGLLPPGDYVARAVIAIKNDKGQRIRPFHLAHAVPAGDAFKADLQHGSGAFHVADVLTAPLLKWSAARAVELGKDDASPGTIAAAERLSNANAGALDGLGVPGDDRSLVASFLRGLLLLKAGTFEDAANEFRASVRVSPDFLPGIFYLGSCYAAGGKLKEAASAWQASLAGDDASPDVYELVSDALLQLDDTDGASDILEEAGAKWPDDSRFARRAAIARAQRGKAADALASLEPWLERTPKDENLLSLAARLLLASIAERPDSEASASLATLNAFSARLQASGATPPPLLERWRHYLESVSAR